MASTAMLVAPVLMLRRLTDHYLTAFCAPSVCRRKSLTKPAISSGFS